MRLLLLEDNPRLRFLLDESITETGWHVDGFEDIATANEAVATIAYDLALVDLGLPDGDGISFIRQLRRNKFEQPILIITARTAIEDRIKGLDAGADDYLVKPFNHHELMARCRALLRRSPLSTGSEIILGRLIFSPALQQVGCADVKIALGTRECALAEILLRQCGQVVTRERLESSLSRLDNETTGNAIELLVSRLRRKLAAHDTGVSIETIRGVGYLLRETPP